MASKTTTADGYIEKRQTPDGERYFAQIDSPGFWYGPLRATRDEARADGQAECRRRGLHAPAFAAE